MGKTIAYEFSGYIVLEDYAAKKAWLYKIAEIIEQPTEQVSKE